LSNPEDIQKEPVDLIHAAEDTPAGAKESTVAEEKPPGG